MATSGLTRTLYQSDELEAVYKQLRREVVLLALPGLGIASLVILTGLGQVDAPNRCLSPSLAIIFLILAVVLLHRWSYVAAAWLLVAGSIGIDLWVVTGSGFEAAIYILPLLLGLATLLLSRVAGVGLAIICTFLIMAVPSDMLPDDPQARTIVVLGIWGTVGLIWLTLRPLLTAVQYTWSSYEQSRNLLEQARDYQARLRETLHDLTDANAQLARLNQQAQTLRLVAEEERRAKEEFVANVSHELRTPLNMVIGFCEMITESPETYGQDIPPALLADLTVVLRNSQHLSSLIDDVLDLSQIEAHRMSLTKERVTLAEVIEAAAVAVRPLFQSKGLYLHIEVPGDLPEILCDRTRIREVMLNLLSNAGRFTEEGGVTVRVRRDNNCVVVSVADTGPGISEADQQRLFRPFQQLDPVVQRRFGGTGLGLSISKGFVELHEGKMWVESQLGHGTTFFVRLPIEPPAPLTGGVPAQLIPGWEFRQRTHRSRVPKPDLRPRWVVVEKGQAMRRLLSRYMDGVEIVPVTDLSAATQNLAISPTQALLVNTTRIDEKLQQISRMTLPYDIPVLICSIPDADEAASSLGVADYLLKPVSREMLLEALDRLGKKVETVLIVDDDPDARQLFRRLLATTGRGYRVIRASDGRQALAILEREKVDVILLDLVMPNLNGFELLAARDEHPSMRDIPIIIISARDPQGQPIVSNALAVTNRNGLSVADLLASIGSLTAILSKSIPPDDPIPSRATRGWPACG